MLRRAAGSLQCWLPPLLYVGLSGIHHSADLGWPAALLSSLAAPASLLVTRGWSPSAQRRDLDALLSRTWFGRGGLAAAEISLGMIAGAAAGLAGLAALRATGVAVPWQAWPVPVTTAATTSLACLGLGRRGEVPENLVMTAAAFLSMAPADVAFTSLLGWPAHLGGLLASAGGTAGLPHPDAFLAASAVLAAASIGALSIRRVRREQWG
jgi:hypothetical protein